MTNVNDAYEVLIVKYGTLNTKKSNVYLNYHLYQDVDQELQMDYFFWVLRNDARIVVVDTGFSRHGGDVRGRTTVTDISELLSVVGVDPLSSPDVIVTHAHYDHVGNLNLFPSSRVFMARDELDFWNSRHGHRAMFHHSIEEDEVLHLNQVNADGRLILFDDAIEVAPGIDVVTVGGHTPGQAVVKVRTPEGTALLASDAIHFYEEFDRDRLFMSVADLIAMYEGFDRIREMHESGEIQFLVAGHDPSTLERFTPFPGPYASQIATIGAGANQ